MNPDEVMGIVERIAEMLTPGAQQAWEIAMRQVDVQIMMEMRWLWFFIIGAIGSIIVSIAGANAPHGSTYYDDDPGAGMMMFGVIGFLVFTVLVLAIWCDTSAMRMNPEYEAVKILLGLVGGR